MFKNNSLYLVVLVSITCVVLFFISGCTKDDICPEGSPTSPKTIILFRDKANITAVKAVPNLRISLTNIEPTELLFSNSGDTLVAIPLSPDLSEIQLAMTTNFSSAPNTDYMTITYSKRQDVYINRACSFTTTFDLLDASRPDEGSANWISNIVITNSAVVNEDVTHITIFH